MKVKVKHIKKPDLELILSEPRNYQLVDVRTPAEYRMGKIKGFKNLPLQDIHNAPYELDTSQPVVIICETGMRSRMAAKMLIRLGFEQVINVKGGLSAFNR